MSEISQQGNRYQYDVLVIGTGIAGLCYALQMAKLAPTARIALISKTKFSDSNSCYAQGGIAAAGDSEQAIAMHVADTLEAGDALCHQGAAETIIRHGLAGIEFLQQQGMTFSCTANGEPELAREGGHSARRIYHHNDFTGQEIIRVLIAAVQAVPQITCYEYHTAVNLITQTPYHQPQAKTMVAGAYVLDQSLGLIHTYLAKVVVLATGGAGKVFRYTTNPEVATGDGIAMAYRAGARVGNMEFYQFHPTLLYHPQKNNFLISEALRGEGAHLRLSQNGERFMRYYDPDNMELATRDIVARAIFNEIEKGAHACVYLDIRHKSKAFLQQRFPGIYQTLLKLNLDMSQTMIPVVPAAHYLCGGVLTDVYGRTDIDRLLAIGETAFTGFHGANRLASNSLLEAVVMAQLAAQHSQRLLTEELPLSQPISDWDSQCVTDLRRASQINAHWRGLRGEMTSYAGIIRTEEGLRDMLKLIRARAEMIEDYYWKHVVTRDFIELRNIVLVAELIVRSALLRQESRGGHYRADFPQRASHHEETILCSPSMHIANHLSR